MSGVKSRLVATIIASVLLAGVPAPVTASDPASAVVTVEKIGNGSGRVTSIPAGIECGDSCTASFASLSVVDLVVGPDEPGSVFVGWKDGDCGGPAPFPEYNWRVYRLVPGWWCPTDMTEILAQAQFDLLRDVNVSVIGLGSVLGSYVEGENEFADIGCSTDPYPTIESDCNDQVRDTKSYTLDAWPAAGYMFAGWSGACTGWTCNIAPGADRVDVTARFVRRALLRNRAVQFKNWLDGTYANGGTVTWRTTDGKYKSTKSTPIGKNGTAIFSSIPGGEVEFLISKTSMTDWTASFLTLIDIDAGPTKIDLISTPSIHQPMVHVTLPNGQPVPGAKLSGSNGYSSEFPDRCTVSYNGAKFLLKNCRPTATTDANGYASLRMVDEESVELDIEVSDGDIGYLWADSAYSDPEVTPAIIEVVIEPLPYVDMLTLSGSVSFASRTTFTAVAIDDAGDPIAGKVLTIKSKVAGASASTCRAVLRATTNVEGVATFAACPIKTTTWTIDGPSIIGSDGATVTVRTRPSAPRSPLATAAVGKIALKWTAPSEINAGKVTDYVVQYRRVGASAWTTFKDGTSTKASATVSKLTAAQAYEFRVAAKNWAGQGAWSDVVIATPR